MYFGDFESILYALVQTGLFGLAAAAVLYALWAVLSRRRFPCRPGTHVLRYAFLAYLICLCLLTLRPDPHAAAEHNLLPFFSLVYAVRSGSATARLLILLNILLFVPMGVLVPCVLKKIDRLWKAALLCAAAALLIEFIQLLLPGRTFDIDDILFNALGGALGYALFVLAGWVFRRRRFSLSTRAAALAVLAIVPAAIGVIALTAPEFTYDLPYNVLAPPQAEFACEGNFPRRAVIYRASEHAPGETLRSLMATFGLEGAVETQGAALFVQDGQGSLSLYAYADLHEWTYTRRDAAMMPFRGEDVTLPAQAQQLLGQYGLWDDSLTNVEIDDILADPENRYPGGYAIEIDPATGREILPAGIIVAGKAVRFAGDEADPNVRRLQVLFDAAGAYEIGGSAYACEPFREVDILSPGKALEQLRFSDRCELRCELPAPVRARFDKATLVYGFGNNAAYRLPVWRLEGEFFDRTGASSHGALLIGAL